MKALLPPLKSFWREFQDDDITGLAAECAFRFFLALFPFILFLVTLAAVCADIAGANDPSGKVLDVFGDSLPEDASSVLESQVNDVVKGSSIGLLSISFVSALWAAAGGAGALIKAVNRVYDLPETRKFWEKSAMAVGLTVIGSVTLITAVVAMVYTQTFADAVASRIGLGSELGWIIQLMRLPLIVLFVMLASQAIYWLSPDKHGRVSFASWGSTAFAVGWAMFTLGFAVYVSNFGSYNATYGALAGVVILLFWFYVSSILFLTGAELNWWLSQRESVRAAAHAVANADAQAPTAGKPARNRPAGYSPFAFALGGLLGWAAGRSRRQGT
jgi:membrane protein